MLYFTLTEGHSLTTFHDTFSVIAPPFIVQIHMCCLHIFQLLLCYFISFISIIRIICTISIFQAGTSSWPLFQSSFKKAKARYSKNSSIICNRGRKERIWIGKKSLRLRVNYVDFGIENTMISNNASEENACLKYVMPPFCGRPWTIRPGYCNSNFPQMVNMLKREEKRREKKRREEAQHGALQIIIAFFLLSDHHQKLAEVKICLLSLLDVGRERTKFTFFCFLHGQRKERKWHMSMWFYSRAQSSTFRRNK